MDKGQDRGRDRVGDVEEILNREMAVVVNYIAYFRGKWVWGIGQTGIGISAKSATDSRRHAKKGKMLVTTSNLKKCQLCVKILSTRG